MCRQQLRDAGEVDLGSVLTGQSHQLSRVQFAATGQLGHGVEELLETCGRDDLEDPGWRVACVPERVPLAAGLEDQVAYLAKDDLAAEVGADSTLEHKAVLILATVPVHRRGQCA